MYSSESLVVEKASKLVIRGVHDFKHLQLGTYPVEAAILCPRVNRER